MVQQDISLLKCSLRVVKNESSGHTGKISDSSEFLIHIAEAFAYLSKQPICDKY